MAGNASMIPCGIRCESSGFGIGNRMGWEVNLRNIRYIRIEDNKTDKIYFRFDKSVVLSCYEII